MDRKNREFARKRLSGEPNDIYVNEYRKPQWEFMKEYFWEPLITLNESQTIVLAENGIITKREEKILLESIKELSNEGVENIPDDAHTQYEDLYLYIEKRLSDIVGDDLGGKIHTGRSRNDLYGACIRIAMRKELIRILKELLSFRKSVIELAQQNIDVIFPSYTHSQPAQPILFSHYWIAFEHLLSRDYDRLVSSYERCNQSPLGAAAIGGTGFPLDRTRLAELSGFSGIQYNTYDSISSMDFVPEAMNALAIYLTNISRISRDLIEWSMFEFQYIDLSDEMSTVSSIMPQKKNPSVLEQTRTAASNTIGANTSSLTHLKASRYGDCGERSRYVYVPFLDSTKEVIKNTRVIDEVLKTIEINEQKMIDAVDENFCSMTALADSLVRKEGLSFRAAHDIVAIVVNGIVNENGSPKDITMEKLNEAANNILGQNLSLTNDDLREILDPFEIVQKKDVTGGTSSQQTKADISKQIENLKEDEEIFSDITNGIRKSDLERKNAHPDSL